MNLRWGIIGCGHIAAKFAEDLAGVENNILQAVASRSITKARTFADAHQVDISYGSYQELYDDPNVDVVYLATPHSLHMSIGIEVMNHSKHLLCEKPLAVNAQQVNKLLEVAKRNRVFLMEALWSRFNPSIQAVTDRIDRGEIGEVKYINADFYFQKDFDPEHRLFNPDLAGGALLDIGIYPLFLSYLILGKPNAIQSTSRLHENGIDLQTSAVLEYDNAQSIISCGIETQSDLPGSINGSLGSIELHNRWHETQGYNIIKDGERKEYQMPTQGYGYTYEILECYECIMKGKMQSELWSHRDSLNLIEICDEIRNQNGIKYQFENF